MDLIAEADEALRRERLEKLWKEYSRYLLAGLALAVVLTGGLSAYRSWDAGVQESSTAALLTLMEDPAFPGNALEKTADMRPATKAIGMIMAARRHIQNGENEKALELLAAVSAEPKTPAAFRDMATVMKISMQPQTAETADASIDSLNAVIKDEKSPWRHHARLLAASIAAEVKKDYASAVSLLQAVLDTPELPPSIYGRAARLLRLYEALAPAPQQNDTGSAVQNDKKQES